MHLIINTLSITSSGGGIKTYLTNIISSLAHHKRKPTLTLICSRTSYTVFKFLEKEENIHFIIIPVSSRVNFFRIFIDQIIVPVILLFNSKKGSILITPSSIATIFSPIRQITIIQAPLVLKNIRKDLPEEYFSDLTYFKRVYYDFFLPKTLKKSDIVITVSGYLKRRLLDLNQISNSDKIKVVYEGVDVNYIERSITDEKEQRSAIEILFVSTLYRYKNADKLIKALGQLKAEKTINKDLKLKIIGNDPTGGTRLKSLKSLTVEYGIEEYIEFLGYVPHEEIGRYYAQAFIFVFPSAVETFGLPPLEAMACGVPVIASNRMSVPEIVGDAGLVIDPEDTDSIAQAIKEVIQNHELRQTLIIRGYERIKDFRWSDAAEKILEIANQIA